MKTSQASNIAPRLGPKAQTNQKNHITKKNLKKEDSLGENSLHKRQSIQDKEKDKTISSQSLSKQLTKNSIEKSIRADLQFIFEGGHSDSYPNKPYHSDGDPSMYTAEAVREREQLKNDVEVKQQVYNFMKHYRFDENGQLSKNEYFAVHLQLASLLREDLSSEYKQGELRFILEQDWKHDSKGKEKMSRDDLFHSLFELVDLWTPTTRKQEYLDFFTLVSDKLGLNPNEYEISKTYEAI